MRKLYSFLPSFVSVVAVLSLPVGQSVAQNSYLENTSLDQRLISGANATNPADITHSFIVRRLTPGRDYSPVLQINNTGRMRIGYDLGFTAPASLLNVGTGATNFSVDELATARDKPNVGMVSGIPGAGACIGFNAARQLDADIGCSMNTYTSNGTTQSRNGGALIWGDDEGGLSFTTFPSNHGTTGNVGGAQYYSPSDAQTYRVMKLRPKGYGQVQIGPFEPQSHPDYRLAVDGKLVAKSIFVTQTTTWADFVFEPTYALRSLPELEDYLHLHRHLPAIPSAAEVATNGLDLAELNAKLLQNLEELTLHVIALGKQNAQLQAEVAALAARMNQAAATPVAGK